MASSGCAVSRRGMEQRVRSLEVTVTADGTIHAMTLEELDGSRTSFAVHG